MTNLKTIKFQDGSFEMDVNVSIEDRTIWMNQKEIAELYDRSISTINEHIINILNEGYDNHDNSTDEQQPTQTVRCFGNSEICVENLDIKKDGKTRYYNLKIIILVGQRVRSNRGLLLKELLDKYLDETFVASYKILRFSQDNLELDVTVSPQEKTVWLTKEQIALLYDRDRSVISRHINNLYKIGELKRESTCAKNAHIPSTRNRLYETELYNLDVIISVGYRVKSQRGVIFRKWANSVLKEYLLKGYVINDNRALVTLKNYINLADHVNAMEVNLSKELDALEERLSAIEEKQKHLLVEEKIFYENQEFDAIVIMTRIIETAKQRIVLFDPYVEALSIDLFKNKHKDVELLVITSSKAKLKNNEISAFNTQYGNLTVVIDNKIHDRYLILDDEMFYHLGSSINHLGKRLTQITLMEDSEIINSIRKRVDDIEYDIYVAKKVNEGIADAEAGRVIPLDEAFRDLKEKYKL